jgi:hypothetical protein
MRESNWERSAKDKNSDGAIRKFGRGCEAKMPNQVEELRLRACKTGYPHGAMLTDKFHHKLRLVRWEPPQGEKWFAHATLMDVNKSRTMRLSYLQVATELSAV